MYILTGNPDAWVLLWLETIYTPWILVAHIVHLLLGGELEHGVEPSLDDVPPELHERLHKLPPGTETFSDDIGNDLTQCNPEAGHLHLVLDRDRTDN